MRPFVPVDDPGVRGHRCRTEDHDSESAGACDQRACDPAAERSIQSGCDRGIDPSNLIVYGSRGASKIWVTGPDSTIGLPIDVGPDLASAARDAAAVRDTRGGMRSHAGTPRVSRARDVGIRG